MNNDRKIDFSKDAGLVPAVVQDARTGAVLMLGYMNKEALEETKRSGNVTFYSRSKNRLWTKGETSGNFLKLQNIAIDCDGDALLIQAIPQGPVCHTGDETCFGEKSSSAGFLMRLEDVLRDRKRSAKEGSYTSALFAKGVAAIAQKVGEEATEVIVASLSEDELRLKNEAADLLYHLIVILLAKELSLEDVIEVLEKRHKG